MGHRSDTSVQIARFASPLSLRLGISVTSHDERAARVRCRMGAPAPCRGPDLAGQATVEDEDLDLDQVLEVI